MRVLLVEEDAELRRWMRDAIARLGHAVDPVCDGENGGWFLRHHKYAMLIASASCPSIDAVLGKERAAIPTIITTLHRSDLEHDRQLIKPFTESELVESVTTLTMERSQPRRFGNLEVDFDSRRVLRDRRPVSLSHLEFRVFELLASRAGTVVPRSEIYERVFRRRPGAQPSNVVDVYVGYLRGKLGRDLIQTVPGVGYLFDPSFLSDPATR